VFAFHQLHFLSTLKGSKHFLDTSVDPLLSALHNEAFFGSFDTLFELRFKMEKLYEAKILIAADPSESFMRFFTTLLP
jgi:hypothetical protein